jgi:ABC-2 type transport system ATP-binding protein
MQHAERLCDRILLIARGRKIFDGTLAEARRVLPRRVRIETADPAEPLRGLPEVLSLHAVPPAADGHARNGALWDIELREQADPQSILQACFEQRIRLQSFNQSDPTLHDVFVRLVGPDAREAAFR